ncbi:hypothetical protein [Legionella jordanis]|uniref:Uncharacterized protein n=1 Tax=Legionella jordanis TaxID=456 RepID=A0A0W0VCS3_9GAMM|nr:hypothetical protein [Legionella jordanis]KTD17931.1 hypothetical protein Ljor_2237 [Legionella jordanis]RMX02370.1 hypothetical protein EAW55_08970 [Legionella jordanis]RMX15756.1 hypothetical protein EAS68_11605 [Legionella jordanis]VEH13978.1 Uncharacterised protein [Legionella jordanis]HAT8714346.1 hypothetical protein [Legionella jordanis]
MAYDPHFPLTELFESRTFPHARTLRTSFLQKLWDTYNAFAGKAPILSRKPHSGIFDYLTLYAAAGLLFLMLWCFENAHRNFLATVLLLPVALINIPLFIARVAISVVTTIAFSPLIALVHGISRLAAGQSHVEALSLVGRLKNGKEQSLGNYLAKEHMDIEELNVTIKKSPQKLDIASLGKDDGFSSYQLMFWRKATGSSAGLACEGCLNGGCDTNHAPFSVEIKPHEASATKQAANIHALFKLNVGDVVSNIEEADIGYSAKQALLVI